MMSAVVGHVEWTRIARVKAMPDSGDVIHADQVWEGPAGGGAVAAVQTARLAGICYFFTALGDDESGRRSRVQLEAQGVRVISVTRDLPTRQAVSLVDDSSERTTVTLGERLQPSAMDPLPWDQLAAFDSIYFTAGDAALLRLSRAAKSLTVTCRELAAAREAGVHLDAMVGSAADPAEAFIEDALAEAPDLLVTTFGSIGGTYSTRGVPQGSYGAIDPTGPVIDRYGVGDSFAAGLAFGLGVPMDHREALLLAARCGAECVSVRGPFALLNEPRLSVGQPYRVRG